MPTQFDPDICLSVDNFIARVEFSRPPDNFFDVPLIENLAAIFAELDGRPDCRVIVLASRGKCFCAGGRLLPEVGAPPALLAAEGPDNPLYLAAVSLFRIAKPIIAEVQGPAIGGGLGLALVADFRIATPSARFAGNFVQLGLHPGFGVSHTLPRLIGAQKAGLMLLTGRRIKAEQALDWGLIDELVPAAELSQAGMRLAAEIAAAAPLAVVSTRAIQRRGLAEAVLQATRHEFAEQRQLAQSDDFAEGLRAVAQRRPGRFQGR